VVADRPHRRLSSEPPAVALRLPSPIAPLLAAGRIDEARDLALRRHAAAPDRPETRYDRGLVELVAGRPAEAVGWLEAAVELAPDRPPFHCNLGQALLGAGRRADAIAAFRRALELAPDYEVARFNLGSALLAGGDVEAAGGIFDALAEQVPDNAEYACARADAARQAGRWRRAIDLYKRALAIDSDHARAAGNLGALLVYFGRGEEALELCSRAVELSPDSWLPRLNLGRALVELELLDEAVDVLADAFELESGSPTLCAEIGRVFSLVGESGEASRWYARALELRPGDGRARAGMATTLLDAGDAPAALRLLDPATDDPAEEVELRRARAAALWDDGDVDGALRELDRIAELQPDHATLHARRGQILSSAGRLDEAAEANRRALELNPGCVPALHGIAMRERGKLDRTLALRIEQKLEGGALRAGTRATLHNALAFYRDGRQEWPEAARQMELGNALQWEHQSGRGWDYDRARHREHCERLRAAFSSEHFERTAGFGVDTLFPVFVVGMPRSGTTLTEQILARHPRVLGAGERNFATRSFHSLAPPDRARDPVAPASATAAADRALERLAAIDEAAVRERAEHYLQELAQLDERSGATGVARVVDKMPDNYALLGWILTLFPRARVIHCRRDPRDVALSCWITQFARIQWASRTDDLVDRIRDHQATMGHWRTVLAGRFLEVDYEELVSDQERESRRLVDWIGLEWDDACLSFYDSPRPVRTASVLQVRQPIHRRSVGRWRPYRELIPELFEGLEA